MNLNEYVRMIFEFFKLNEGVKQWEH